MELVGKFKKSGEEWLYQCPLFTGRGVTPDMAYADYLKKFEYKGLPLTDCIENGDEYGATN